MLRTTTKAAISNIRNYIIENFDSCNYSPEYDNIDNKDFCAVANVIYDCFYNEKVKFDRRRITIQDLFIEWCAGLPSILDTCYFYNRSAVDDLGKILEETEEEKAKYTEQQAENYLTYLIYREIRKVVKK